MLIYIFSAIFLYLIIGIVLFVIQRRMTFNKSGKPYSPEKYGLRNIKEVFIETPDNLKLLAWYHKPNNGNPILIYFHGNSYDIGERAYRIERYINKGWGVLLLAWRGYSGNQGIPTEKNLYIDGLSAIDWVKQLFSDPVAALKVLWKGLLGTFETVTDILYWPVNKAINWIKDLFFISSI